MVDSSYMFLLCTFIPVYLSTLIFEKTFKITENERQVEIFKITENERWVGIFKITENERQVGIFKITENERQVEIFKITENERLVGIFKITENGDFKYSYQPFILCETHSFYTETA
jgi:AAA15 family ATPase/GTPase